MSLTAHTGHAGAFCLAAESVLSGVRACHEESTTLDKGCPWILAFAMPPNGGLKRNSAPVCDERRRNDCRPSQGLADCSELAPG